MNLLYIEASPRGRGVSRTLLLADAFMDAFGRAWPDAQIVRHDVAAMGLEAVDGPLLARREALIDRRAFDDPLFAPARDFARADAIVVTAPYWDLMFPAMLKVYVEHIFIRELTFRYENDRPIGLCRARRALFLTTAGSPIGGYDFGTDYLRATFGMLGIGQVDSVAAEGLDLAGADAEGLLAAARARAIAAAEAFL